MKQYIGVLMLSALLPLGACQPSRQETPEQTRVTEEDVQERMEWLSAEDAAFAKTPLGRQNLVQIILREKLIQADAHAQGLDKSADYRHLIANKRAQLDQIYQQYTRQLLEDFWYTKHREHGDLQITDEEINEYYKKYPYEMTVQQIIVDNAQTADEVLRTLKYAPSRWKEMARKYSTAPETIRDSKFTFMPGEFLPEIEVIAANSASGSVQGFIKTALGFHIIMKTGEKRLTKMEATPRIRAVLENKKLDKILESLQNKYEVMIYAKEE